MGQTVTLFDIIGSSFVDGPGVRTTVFFKGCNLRCKWCHNPESQSSSPHLFFHAEKCTHCGRCTEVCPNHGQGCSLCGRCAELCPQDARELCGKTWTTEAVMAQIFRDKPFFDASGGGVTFSGGECMLQINALLELLQGCRAAGIHTAVDTAGNVPFSYFERIVPYTDLFLYDVKCFDAQKHREGTGVSNERILENLTRLPAAATVLIRIPIICGFNDSVEEMQHIAAFLRTVSAQISAVELLPYHKMGEHKYPALGRKKPAFAVPDPRQISVLQDVFLAL